MDPLIEVSTIGGRNMRATCARVLAAALMTGAIATVVGMAAHLGAPSAAESPIAAPPSSLQRSIRLTAQPASARPARARLVTTDTTRAQPRPAILGGNLVVIPRHHRSRRPPASRQLAATTTTPPAIAAPSAPAVAPAAQPDQAPPPDAPPADHGHGHGHAYGQDKQDD